MKKFNLANQQICVDKEALLEAINSQKDFGITIEGAIVYAPFDTAKHYIFQGKHSTGGSLLSRAQNVTLADFFGKSYHIVEEGDRVCIDASDAWSEIVPLNLAGALYDDTTSDGIMDFADEVLEDISWHAVEFGITNRDIAEIIEAECEGLLFCVHKEEPFFFSALGYVDDISCAREKVHSRVAKMIEEKLRNDPDYDPNFLDEEQEEAVEYFGIAR